MKKDNTLIALFVFIIVAFGLAVFYKDAVNHIIKSPVERGLFGDAFGAFTAFFTALAFIIMAASLYYQRKDYLQTLEEFEKQTNEFKNQRELFEKERIERIEDNAPLLSPEACDYKYLPLTSSNKGREVEHLIIQFKNKGGLIIRWNPVLIVKDRILLETDICSQVLDAGNDLEIRAVLDTSSLPDAWPLTFKLKMTCYGKLKSKVTQLFEISKLPYNQFSMIPIRHDFEIME